MSGTACRDDVDQRAPPARWRRGCRGALRRRRSRRRRDHSHAVMPAARATRTRVVRVLPWYRTCGLGESARSSTRPWCCTAPGSGNSCVTRRSSSSRCRLLLTRRAALRAARPLQRHHHRQRDTAARHQPRATRRHLRGALRRRAHARVRRRGHHPSVVADEYVGFAEPAGQAARTADRRFFAVIGGRASSSGCARSSGSSSASSARSPRRRCSRSRSPW